MGYSPWGHKKLDMTEQLTLSLHFHRMLYHSSEGPSLFISQWKIFRPKNVSNDYDFRVAMVLIILIFILELFQ